MLLQPFSDNTCLEIWCIIMVYVQVWINCTHGGMDVCQENISYPIGAGSPLEKIKSFRARAEQFPGQVTFLHFSPHYGEHCHYVK